MSAPEVVFGPEGLVPCIAQDSRTGEVLMLAWMNREALDRTVETGEVHFFSRSRGELWRKGETSGNLLRLVELRIDCDGDSLLALVDPAGPACHTGERTCFLAGQRAVVGDRVGWVEAPGEGGKLVSVEERSTGVLVGLETLVQASLAPVLALRQTSSWAVAADPSAPPDTPYTQLGLESRLL